MPQAGRSRIEGAQIGGTEATIFAFHQFRILEARTRIEQHDALLGTKIAPGSQELEGCYRRSSFGTNEDSFETGALMNTFEDFIVADGNRISTAVANSAQDEIVSESVWNTQSGGYRRCIWPGLALYLSFRKRPNNGCASGSLHCNHPGAFFSQPADLLQLIERLPHSQHSGAAAGGVNDCVGQLPIELLGEFESHGFL